MSIERTLHCHMCRGPTLHSVRKERTFLKGDKVKHVTYSKICPEHKHEHPKHITVPIEDWKELLKAGKNWKA